MGTRQIYSFYVTSAYLVLINERESFKCNDLGVYKKEKVNAYLVFHIYPNQPEG
jgi:hypothetical protein